ncbi:formylglycine-generating enzyme family protein [Polyangium aurulentum]|uniref:formylglycine-generating enzyme family protein n=1 Tax=Polyangium aurulentum TaxID=2567896 RepID=UPI0010AE5C1E|nr:SUMF1/EgtB/PvdO family nonheme iron enzyme [Polyangium aurulentum]UQA56137.1 SUMF1/EgtB/PvdO family nonheme iron enzyme [Polyangium aurulentum]
MKPREAVVFPVVLALSLGTAALLFWPRVRSRDAAAPPPVEPTAAPVEPAVTAPPKPPPPPLPAYVHPSPDSAAACGEGMVLVDGVYCPFVGHRCIDKRENADDVCERFGPEVLCEGTLERKRFCVDVYEYPNMEGVLPAVLVDFNEAKRACAVEGKRLCSVEEWEFACEGPGMWPYPYGAERDAEACNIDRPILPPDMGAFSEPRSVGPEMERVDKRVASGAMPRCISPFGVRDMTGNVDEWVDNPQGKRIEPPYRSSLKGGAWGATRGRCRPITASHDEHFRFYQVGFRCCADPKDGRAANLPPGTRRPKVGRMDLPERDRPPRGRPGRETP